MPANKTVQLWFRVTEGDQKAIEVAAEQYGLRVSEFCRLAVQNMVRNMPPVFYQVQPQPRINRLDGQPEAIYTTD